MTCAANASGNWLEQQNRDLRECHDEQCQERDSNRAVRMIGHEVHSVVILSLRLDIHSDIHVIYSAMCNITMCATHVLVPATPVWSVTIVPDDERVERSTLATLWVGSSVPHRDQAVWRER